MGSDGGPDAGALDAGPEVCDGITVERVSGQLLATDGTVPTAPVITLCGSVCLTGELLADGTFVLESDTCYRDLEPLPHPVVIYHGAGLYADLHVDVVPRGLAAVGPVELTAPLYVPPRSAMATAEVADDQPLLLDDGEGLRLEAEAGATFLPFGATSVAAGRVDPVYWPPAPGIEGVVSLWALATEGTLFDPPARLVLPTPPGWPAGTLVDVVVLGNPDTGEVYPGTVGSVGTSPVTAEGTVVVDELRALSWIGLRLR